MFLPACRSMTCTTPAGRRCAAAAPGNLRLVDRAGDVLLLLVASVSLTGCQLHMVDQPRVDTLQPSAIFHDGRGQRPPVAGTIARGSLVTNVVEQTGLSDGQPVEHSPIPLTDDLLSRGQQRFMIYCSPCHGPAGYGNGLVVQRGFPAPPSYHIDRLASAGAGELFKVITQGRGRMPAFGRRIDPHDRWAIIAYIRALQLSQSADLADLPESDRQRFSRSAEND